MDERVLQYTRSRRPRHAHHGWLSVLAPFEDCKHLLHRRYHLHMAYSATDQHHGLWGADKPEQVHVG